MNLVYDSIAGLKQQVTDAWSAAQKVTVPDDYQKINKIILAGMGGSLLGGRVIQAVFANELPYPLILVNDYHLPDWADEKTLVICSSYSGETEETLTNAEQALKQGSKLMIIAACGRLLALAKANHLPYYEIKPVFNPSKQPRLAIGYSIIGQLVLCQKAGLINLNSAGIDELTAAMDRAKPADAQTWAEKLKDKQIILVGAEFLTGAIHVIKNQINENAKQLAHRYDLPELNHHLMEGLQFPATNPQTIFFWFIDSALYSAKIRRRLTLTKDVVEKNHLATWVWQATATTKLAQAFEVIQFGAYVGFYLSQLHGVDPAAIPWVNYFKAHL